MKIFTFLALFFTLSLTQAQVHTYDIPLGQNTKVNIDTRSNYQMDNGELHGDFSEAKGMKHVQVKNGELIMTNVDREICYTTNPINVSNMEAFGFSMAFSGEGTLDNMKGHVLRDWIDVSYILDGEKTLLGNDDHTMSGIPQAIVKQDWVTLNNNETVNLQVCMQMTGADEFYTLHGIQFFEKEKNTDIMTIEFEEIEIRQDETNNSMVNTLNLNVYPNPVSDWLYIKNTSQFDLQTIEVLNLQGQIIRKGASYPINLEAFQAGEYFVKVAVKNDRVSDETKYATQKFVVIKR